MIRRGFTMIELIFVIVILGILAAVAIPKLVGIQGQAHAAKTAELVGSLNSVVVPALWGSAQITDGGDVGKYLSSTTISNAKKSLSYYMEVPTSFLETNTLATVFANTACDVNTTSTTSITPCIVLSDTSNSLYVYGRDGNSTDAPRFWYSTKATGATAANFDISKSSF